MVFLLPRIFNVDIDESAWFILGNRGSYAAGGRADISSNGSINIENKQKY